VAVQVDREGEGTFGVARRTPAARELIVGDVVSCVRIGERRGYLGHAKARPLPGEGGNSLRLTTGATKRLTGVGPPGGATVEAVPSGAASLSL
jgi:hypothetical protein